MMKKQFNIGKHTCLLIAAIVYCSSIVNASNLNPKGILPGDTFNSISIDGSMNVVIVPSDSCYVHIKTKTSETPMSGYRVKGHTLKISKDIKGKTTADAKIIVGIKTLKHLELNGGANVTSQGTIRTDHLYINTSGAGDVKMTVKAQDINSVITGAGNITLRGTADSLSGSISGAGSLEAFKLQCSAAKVTVSGAGDARVNARNALYADVSGAGSIVYKGSPAIRHVNISGIGSIEQANASGQVYEPDSTQVRIKIGKGKKLIIINDNRDTIVKSERKKKRASDFEIWSGLDLGINGLLTPASKLTLPDQYNFMDLNYAHSIDFSINFLERDIHIYHNYINIVTGLGLEFNSYALQHNVSLNPDTSYTWGSKDTISYTKNKLNQTFINLPLLLNFNTNSHPEKSFHFATGVILGYELNSRTKQKYEHNGRDYRIIVKDSYNTSPFKASATIRAGYANFNLYATYALSPLFQKNKGPELYPFSVGVRLVGF